MRHVYRSDFSPGLRCGLHAQPALGVPRLSADLEMALALAVVALKTDEAATLSAVERRYGHYVLRTPVPATRGVEQLQPV
jgi:hypothetical protein